jgi:hypothetical protein
MRHSTTLFQPFQFSQLMKSTSSNTMVLNVDDNALTNPSKADNDGLIWNFKGNFQFVFYGSVNLFNIWYIEIHAIMIGIQFCWEADYNKLIYFSDSLRVVHLMTKEVPKIVWNSLEFIWIRIEIFSFIIFFFLKKTLVKICMLNWVSIIESLWCIKPLVALHYLSLTLIDDATSSVIFSLLFFLLILPLPSCIITLTWIKNSFL